MAAVNAALCWVNHVIAGTVSVSASVAGRTGTALQDEHGATYWQAPATTAWVQVDALAAVEWGLFAALRTNWTTAATLRWRLGTTAGAGDVYDTGTIAGGIASGYGQSVHVPLLVSYTARYLRLDIVDAANPDGFLRLGHLVGGPKVSFERNFSYGWQVGWADEGSVMTTRGGEDHVVAGARYRVLDMTFEALTDAELYGSAQEIDRIAGLAGNVLAVPRPDSAHLQREALYGRLSQLAAAVNPHLGRWTKSYRIKERL